MANPPERPSLHYAMSVISLAVFATACVTGLAVAFVYATDIFLLLFLAVLFGVFLTRTSTWLAEKTPLNHGWSLAVPADTGSSVHPTEDFRHGVQLAEHGYRVAFANDAHVYTPLRQSLRAATKQNIRWERGRIGNAFTHARQLLYRSIRQRDLKKFIAALDASQPPVAVVIGVAFALALITPFSVKQALPVSLGLLPFVLVIAYGSLVIKQGQREGIAMRFLVWAPIYLAWRLTAFFLAFTRLDRLIHKKSK